MLEWSTPKPDAQPQTIAQARLERRKRRRFMRWGKWCLGIVLAFSIVLVAGRHALFRAVLTSRVESALGVELAGAKFFCSLNGMLSVQDVVLRIPGMEGEAGIVMSAEQFQAQIDFVGLLSGGGTRAITNVRAIKPVIRISQHAEDGSLNIDSIIRDSSLGTNGKGAVYLPEVQVVDATLEFGEHMDDWYAPLASIRAEGVLEAPDRSEPKYELRLSELTDEMRPRMQIRGEIDMRGSSADLHLVDLDLSAWAPTAAPAVVRGMWSQMALRGTARDARFHYEPDSGISSEFQLEGVDLAIPVPVPSAGDPESMHPLRMKGVDGYFRFNTRGIEADLHGVVEDVTGRVQLRTQGLGMNDAFESTIRIEPFFFAEGSSLIPFAPPEALEILELFETPQALLEGEIHIVRKATNEPIAVDGRFTFEDGGMAYVDFPYPVHDVRGTVAFDEAGIELIGLHGFGSGGSLLEANGRIEGYDDDAGVDIVIHGQGVPTDRALRESLPKSWGPLFAELFDEPHTQKLRERNLIVSSQEHDALAQQVQALTSGLKSEDLPGVREQLAALGEQLRTPIFDPGGIGETKIHIYRPRGGKYKYDVDVLFPTLWVMPRALPFPLAAEQVVVEVRDTVVQVRAPIVRGLEGGLGEGLITVNLERGAADAEILIETTLRDVPVNEYLLSALPEVEIFHDRPEGSTTLPELLRDMHWQGEMDVDLQYDTVDPADPLLLKLQFHGLDAAPDGVSEPVFSMMEGTASISTKSFEIGPVSGKVYGMPGTMTIAGELGGDDQGVIVEAHVEQLPVESHVGSLVRLFTSRGADAIEVLQRKMRPTGGVDLDIAVDTYGDGTGKVVVRAMQAKDLAFDWLEGRFFMPTSTGSLVYDSTGQKILVRSWAGDFDYNDEPAGQAEATGVMYVGKKAPLDLQLKLQGLRFESQLVHDALRLGSPRIATFCEENQLAGSFDAYLRPIRTKEGFRIARGWVEPRSIVVGSRQDVVIDTVSGRIEFTPEQGKVEGLALHHPLWDIAINGGWRSKPSWQADLGIEVEAFGFDESLRSLLPHKVQDSINAMQFDIAGPWRLERGNLSFAGEGEGSSGEFGGSITMTDASLKAGLELSEIIGQLDVRAHWGEDENQQQVLQINADTYVDNMLAKGIPLHSVSAQIESDGHRTQITDIIGTLNEGNVAGSVSLERDPSQGGPMFAADFRAAGIDLGLFLDAIARRGDPGVMEEKDSSGRGLVSGQIMLSGQAGADVIGRGLLLAEQGTLLDMPFLLGVVELSNLQVPSGEEITYGEVEFAIENGLVTVDHIEAKSKSVRVLGTGTVSLTGGNIDLYFRTRGLRRVPVLSDVVEALRNQIIAARVTGTLKEPVFRAQALPSASRILRQLLRGESDGPRRSWVGVSPRGAPVVTMEQ